MSRASAALLAFLGYLTLSFAYFGSHVAGHPASSYVGYLTDPEIFIWSFAWWPHALLHGENPFVTHVLWAPDGFNLGWSATAPGLALLFAPLTLLAGPVAAYNSAIVLMPALAAWAAFLLCRHVTRSFWASLAGGYLFGFSSYMLGHVLAHLSLVAVFVLPLVALVVLRYVEGELDQRGLIVRLAPLLAAELWFASLELSFTLALSLVIALAVAALFWPAERTRLRSLARPLAASYALAAALAAPLLYYVLSGLGSGTVNAPGRFVTADLLNLAVPTRLVLFSGRVAYRLENDFPGNVFERGSYLGVPALLVVAWFARRRLGTPAGQFLLVCLGLAAVLSFGPRLHVDGHTVLPLPWRLVAGVPLFNNVITARFALYASLVVAVIVAVAASSSRSPWLRFVLPALCVLSLVPDPNVYNAWHVKPDVPAFFAHGTFRSCLTPGENVIALPYGVSGDSTLWQVRAGFAFRQAGGYVMPGIPKSFSAYRAVPALIANEPSPEAAAGVLALARAKRVGAILVDERRQLGWTSFVTGIKPLVGAGVLLYPLEPPPATCSQVMSRQ